MFGDKLKSLNWLVGIIGITSVAIIAFLVGQHSQPSSGKNPINSDALSSNVSSMDAVDVDQPQLPGVGESIQENEAQVQVDPELAAEGTDDPNIENYAYDQARASVDALRDAIDQLPESAEKHAKIQSLMQALLTKAQANSSTLRGLIDAYGESPSSHMGNRLQSILAEIQDPEVESMALNMANSTDPSQKLAGLDLLGRLGIPSEQTFETASSVIYANESSPEIMMAALNALPKMTLPDTEHTKVIQDLSALAQSSDHEGVRSSSLFSIGKWAKDANDLSVVMNTLSNEGSPDSRISAAMALSESTVVDPELQSLFVNRMSDSDELWEIRRMSAESLQRFKLSGEDYAAYQAFLEEQGDVALGQ